MVSSKSFNSRALLYLIRARPIPVSNRASPRQCLRSFSSTSRNLATNRIFTSVRNPADFNTLLLLSSSSHQPLLTLWTASWAPSSTTASSLLTQLISEEKIGENVPSTFPDAAGGSPTGVGFVEVEADAPDMMAEDMLSRYMVHKVPMLLAFSRGEAQVETRVMDERQLLDRTFLIEWIEKEAARGGGGGGGGSMFGRWWRGWGGG